MRTNNHSIVDKIVNTADEFGFFWNDFVPAILQPIPKPSHSFLMVEIVALLLRPLTILLTVDCVTPLKLHSLLIEISRCLHSSIIRVRTASPMFMRMPPLQKSISKSA